MRKAKTIIAAKSYNLNIYHVDLINGKSFGVLAQTEDDVIKGTCDFWGCDPEDIVRIQLQQHHWKQQVNNFTFRISTWISRWAGKGYPRVVYHLE